MDLDPSNSFLQELPFSHHQSEGGVVGEMDVTESLLVPGRDQVRISALASVADVITGVLISSRTTPALALTVDLGVRVIRPPGLGPLELTSRVVKLGRTISAAEGWFRRDGELMAHTWATFMASPRPQDTIPGIAPNRARGPREITEPFAEALGLDLIKPGIVQVERRPYTLQPAGTLQGGVICAMAEVAAESITESPINEIDVRYLSTVRIGPGRATAEALDATRSQVTIVDAGLDDNKSGDHKVAAMAFTRT
jgi:acyl-coenzyme A thioesterase PaaI-like protein